jgi:hypothetical protein
MMMNCYKGGTFMEQIHIHARKGKTYWYGVSKSCMIYILFPSFSNNHIELQCPAMNTFGYKSLLLHMLPLAFHFLF